MLNRLFLFSSFIIILLQPAYAGYMEVTLLGTGTPRPSIDRFGPATVVEVKNRYFVFDSGRGVTIRLEQANIPLNKIEHVFLTHLHSDHVSGLSDLWLTGWIWQRQTALELTGPTGTISLAHHLQKAFEADYGFRHNNTGLSQQSYNINATELDCDTVVYDQDGIKITAFLVNHMPVSPAFGYKVEYGEESVVISGDTSYSDNLIKYAKDADLLIHEICAASPRLLEQNQRLQKVVAYHTTPVQLTEILNKSKPKATALNHVLLFGVRESDVVEKLKSGYSGNVRIGEDLMKIRIGNDVVFD